MFDLKQSWPYYGWVHCNPHIKEWEIYHKIFFGQLRCFLKKRIFTILDMPAYLYLCHFKNLPVTLSVFQATGRPPHIKGKLGHNRNSKFAGQGALFSFSNLTAVPNEFPIQEYDIIAQRETTRVENFFWRWVVPGELIIIIIVLLSIFHHHHYYHHLPPPLLHHDHHCQTGGDGQYKDGPSVKGGRARGVAWSVLGSTLFLCVWPVLGKSLFFLLVYFLYSCRFSFLS